MPVKSYYDRPAVIHVRTAAPRRDPRINARIVRAATRCGAPVTNYDLSPGDVRTVALVAIQQDWLSQLTEPCTICPDCLKGG